MGFLRAYKSFFFLQRHVFLIASALCYAGAFFIPNCFFFATIFSLLLVQKVVATSCAHAFIKGCAWGCLVYGLLLLPILFSLWPWIDSWLKLPLFSALVLWCGLSAGIWLLLIFFVARIAGAFIAWLGCTLLFLWYMNCAVLWPFGQIEGLFFADPLLPLAAYPVLLWPLSFIGYWFFLLLLLMVCGGVFLPIVKVRCSAYALLGLWVIGIYVFYADRPVKKALYDRCVAPSIPWSGAQVDRYQHVSAIVDVLAGVKAAGVESPLILLPESALSWSFDKDGVMAFRLRDALSPGAELFFGAQREEGGSLFNTVYRGTEHSFYVEHDKTHGMPCVERVPWWWRGRPWCGERCCTQAEMEGWRTSCIDGYRCAWYLCSEFFFATSVVADCDVVLCLANDGWFGDSVVVEWLGLAARLKALCWRKPVVYVSYRKKWWVTERGGVVGLKT